MSDRGINPMMSDLAHDLVKEHGLKIGIFASLLLLGCIITSSVSSYVPVQVAAPPEEGRSAVASQSSMLDLCFAAAHENYRENWASACSKLGPSDSSPNCALPSQSAKSLEKSRLEDRQACIRLYSRNKK